MLESEEVEEHERFATPPLPPDIISNRNEVCFPSDEDEDDDENLSDSEVSDVDLDNDWFDTQQYDSDASIKSLGTRKQNKWLRPFFAMLNDVSTEPRSGEEDAALHYYCPACRGSGLGETDLYKGFHPLIEHAKHFTKRRVNLHREFAAILEEDQKRVSTSYEPSGRQTDLVGLIQEEEIVNPLIVWPPMVVIQRVGHELDEKQQWLRIRSKELLEIFDNYSPLRVRHAYDLEGCCGLMSLLVFPDSSLGYIHAKLLAKHFKCSERGRKHFLQQPQTNGVARSAGSTQLLLYGYLATKEDMGIFEESDSSKKKVKWGMKRYADAVLQPLAQMHRSMTDVHRLKAKLQEQEERNGLLEKLLNEFAKMIALKEGSVSHEKPMHYFGELTKATSETEAQQIHGKSSLG